MATTTQTIDARTETLRALREGRELDEVQQLIARDQLQTRRPGTHLGALLALALDVYALTEASREASIPMAGLIGAYLAEYHFHGKVDHRNLHYALTYPALVHGGLRPDLEGDLSTGAVTCCSRPARHHGLHAHRRGTLRAQRSRPGTRPSRLKVGARHAASRSPAYLYILAVDKWCESPRSAV